VDAGTTGSDNTMLFVLIGIAVVAVVVVAGLALSRSRKPAGPEDDE
jgi:LPXTG-motif cell wall-anchored protein